MEGTSFESLPGDKKSCNDLSLSRSMTRPRVLFATNVMTKPGERHVLFRSFYQEEKPLLSSGEQQISISLPGEFKFCPPVRGLICLLERDGTRVVICNPGTKKCRNLPMVQPDETKTMTTHFGYDEKEDVFKVLCTRTKLKGLSDPEYQVLTVGMGPVEERWRRIVCKFPHTPVRDGVYERGVVYYLAYSNYNDYSKNILMSFDARSEDFHPLALPQEVDLNRGFWRVIKYHGKIALVDDDRCFTCDEPNGDSYLETWVRKINAFKWHRILIRKWREEAKDPANEYRFRGTTEKGELVFAPLRATEDGSLVVILYNTGTETFERSMVQLLGGAHESPLVETFLDHVDTPMPI